MERAKTGDLLKAKIQQRPHRQELERRHILEQQEGHIDPSLAEKRRMLEKKFLADQLNSKISHRPGPLELIEKNILHTEEPIEHMVKQGLVAFKAANEGTQKGPSVPSSYVTYEDDSQSSEDQSQQSPIRPEIIDSVATAVAAAAAPAPTAGSLVFTIPTTGGAVVLTSAQIGPPALVPTNAPQIVAEIPPPPPLPIAVNKHQEQTTQNLYAQLCQNTVANSPTLVPLAPSPLGSSTSSLSPMSSVSSPPSQILTRTIPSPLIQSQNQPKSDAPGKDKNRKKSKAKPAAKMRAIKFHEYKGPPSAQKSNSISNSNSEETNYQLALRQQVMLEYLEGMYKQSQATQKTSCSSNPPPLQQIQQTQMQSDSSSIPPSPASTYSDSTNNSGGTINNSDCKFGRMKVTDLKLQLKKLNLPVSGPKPKLIERLKHHHLEAGTEEDGCDFDIMDSPRHSMSPESEIDDKSEVNFKIKSFNQVIPNTSKIEKEPVKMEIKMEEMGPPTPMQTMMDETLAQERQIQHIEELQRKLEESLAQLEQMKQANISEPASVRLKYQLEAKMQKEKLAKLKLQQEHLAFQQAKKQANAMRVQQQQQQAAAAQLVLQQQQQQQQQRIQPTETIINAFITPTKKEPSTVVAPTTVSANGQLFTFYENSGNQIQLATANNANGIPTLFVVGLGSGATAVATQGGVGVGGAVTQVGDIKKGQTHHRTTSMPSIVVPLSTGMLSLLLFFSFM